MAEMTANYSLSTVTDDDGTQMPRYRRELNAALSELTQKVLPLYEMMESLQANNNTHFFDVEIASYKDKIEELKQVAAQKIDKAYEGYLERLEAAYTVQEKQVDPGILALLNPEKVSMTQEEFTMLADQYDENITMRIALRSYAERKGLRYNPPIGLPEKRQRAERVHRVALSYIPGPNLYCPSEWVRGMDGFLLNEANPLTE